MSGGDKGQKKNKFSWGNFREKSFVCEQNLYNLPPERRKASQHHFPKGINSITCPTNHES